MLFFLNLCNILGKNIELIYEDTHPDLKAAVTAVNKFINIDNLEMIIAAEGSGPTLSAAPLADSTKTVMMVGIASIPELREAGDYVFMVVPSDACQGFEMVRLAEELGYKIAAILYINGAYCV